MPAPDLEAFKVSVETTSPTKFNNFVQAVEDEFSDIDADQISGYPASAVKYLRGDGTWPDLGPVQTYTPAWTSSSNPQPSLGNGTSSGRFIQIGKTVWVSGRITMGSTTTFGTGFYAISLPVEPSHAVRHSGGLFVVLSDTGTANHFAFAYPETGASSRCNLWALNAGTGVASIVANNAPFTWADTDVLRWALYYEAA